MEFPICRSNEGFGIRYFLIAHSNGKELKFLVDTGSNDNVILNKSLKGCTYKKLRWKLLTGLFGHKNGKSSQCSLSFELQDVNGTSKEFNEYRFSIASSYEEADLEFLSADGIIGTSILDGGVLNLGSIPFFAV